MNQLSRCLDCIAEPKLYSIEQAIALAFGVVCLGVDVWAVVHTIRYYLKADPARTAATHTFGLVSLCLEPLLALCVILLLAFAFSTGPSKDKQPS